MAKLVNQSRFSDAVVRKAYAWALKATGVKPEWVESIKFGDMGKGPSHASEDEAYAGRTRMGSGAVEVYVGKDRHFPTRPSHYHGEPTVGIEDATEALVGVTAHELFHVLLHVERTARGETLLPTFMLMILGLDAEEEREVTRRTNKVLHLFRKRRSALKWARKEGEHAETQAA